ncbi:MAG: prepilin-type N-terminal cleavage/methylation domain-containing protein [Elusimicrobiota bacterium]|jgi:prepilin-type N-terminal cleavage/methylation domain-containing protein|nr:prepilin-type N-terminal cleavage/methylation domain-containing protein [Elusimicrobiota bacterium]
MERLLLLIPNNNKGFSLAEILAVMIIMAILALVSTPYIRDYIRETENAKAKTALQIIAQGVKNFKADYPRVSITDGIIGGSTTPSCSQQTPSTNASAGILLGCNYIRNVNFGAHRYDFQIGGACCTQASGAVACMKGTGSAPYDSAYCAWVDSYGDVHDTL